MEKFEHNIPEEPKKEQVEESYFARSNRERRAGEYAAIKKQMAELSSLLTRRDNGSQKLDNQINQAGYKLRSSVKDFCDNNPNDARGTALKKLVGLS